MGRADSRNTPKMKRIKGQAKKKKRLAKIKTGRDTHKKVTVND